MKSQFETEAATLTQRIEELASTFERAAKEMTERSQNLEPAEEKEDTTQAPQRRRRRGIGSKLTLDD